MLPLLEKTRMINKLLQNTETVSYKKMAEVLKDVIKANIYIVSSEGELLGYSILDGFECELMIKKVLDVGRLCKMAGRDPGDFFQLPSGEEHVRFQRRDQMPV